MLPKRRRLGAHLPLGHGMVRAAERAIEIGADSIQIFTDNPTAWRRRPTLPRELPAFRERLAAHGINPISVHAPYLVNLAGPEEEVFSRSVEVLANELRVAAAYGAAFLNVHVGSHRGAGIAAGTQRVAEGIRLALAAVDSGTAGAPGDSAPLPADASTVIVVLENGAGGGFGLGSSIDELVGIDHALRDAGVDLGRVGFCLDTAHLWGAGYAIDEPAGVDALIETFDTALGLGRLRMVHLNDSRSELGSRSDRHEHIGAGRIGPRGLARFLTHPALEDVTTILETPGMDEGYDAINLQRARDAAAGRRLRKLPAAAFATRNARGRSAPAEDEVEVPPDTASRAS